MAHALGCGRVDLYLRFDQPVAAPELELFRAMVRRRSLREPVPYITGIKEFWSLPLRVTPQVLIPRPESELLVETALEALAQCGTADAGTVRGLDIGTGSGALAIALARERGETVQWAATDLSSEALEVARSNARSLGVEGRITFFQGDLFDALQRGEPGFSVILSNPPYVPTGEIPRLAPEIRHYEPSTALDGGPDGLTVVRRILEGAPPWLMRGGALLLEVGQGQQRALEQTLKASPYWGSWSWRRDLAGKERVLWTTRT
jgi:release factor glutamine methyltransferase